MGKGVGLGWIECWLLVEVLGCVAGVVGGCGWGVCSLFVWSGLEDVAWWGVIG